MRTTTKTTMNETMVAMSCCSLPETTQSRRTSYGRPSGMQNLTILARGRECPAGSSAREISEKAVAPTLTEAGDGPAAKVAATLALRLRLFVQRRPELRPTPEERAGGDAEAEGVGRELADEDAAKKGRENFSHRVHL